MAESEPLLSDEALAIHIVPVRHHSPACAWHLRVMIEAVAPAMILVEGPCDYDPLIPLLAGAGTAPPVAVVSIVPHSDGGGRTVSYFPFCAHSPEYVAIRESAERKIPLCFIDLPADDKAMIAGGGERDSAPQLLLDEQAFDSSDYVRALAERLGCRDGNEVWDHLFETRIGRGGWQAFFRDVGQYCRLMRQSCARARIEEDGTLDREAQMIGHLAAARDRVSGPILVVVGGFHASALAEALPDLAAAPGPKPASASASPYLIRYGYRQLNALAGYSAGLPLPAYYEALWSAAGAGEADPFGRVAEDLLSGFCAHLRQSLPGAAPSVPVIVSALENAHRLAALRGRPGPLRDDLLDACRSTLLKGEESGFSPVMAELAAFLTGSAIGDVPPSAGSPPLVEAVRERARRLGFRVDDGERRSRELDIYRKPRHREASRFLHAMTFIDAGFAQRTGGPDFRSGVNLDRLVETWSVMWSPMVEARLIERSADGDSLEAATAAELERRVRALADEGRSGDALAAVALFAAACRAGIGERIGALLPMIEAEIVRDSDLGTVAPALRDLVTLWRSRATLGDSDRDATARLIGAVWRRALFLLPDLVRAGAERIGAALEAMAVLREIVSPSADPVPAIDAELFDEAVAALLEAPLDPTLAGAVAALALLSGRLDEAQFGERLAGELGGAYPETARRIFWLRGVIAISRELLWRVPALVDTADRALESLSDEGFVELLPHLRLAFAELDPREIDRLAATVGERHGLDPSGLVAVHEFSADELESNLRADRDLAAMLAAEGLA